MGTLLLDRKALELRLDSQAIALYENGQRLRTVPIALLERIIIRADTQVSTSLLANLADAGVAVIILSTRQGHRMAYVHGRPHNDARIRLAQYRTAQDHETRASWATRLIHAKISAQTRALEHAQSQRPDCRKALHDALLTLRKLALPLRDAAVDLANLLGMEGAAHAAYFRGYIALFPASLGFSSRTRRPPRDPVNAILSLSYTMLHSEAVRQTYAAGLDPFIGFLHEPAFGRESLACDLVEPLRARIDTWVWELFRNRTLRVEHFTQDKGACLLGKAGRQHFYENYQQFSPLLHRALRRHTRLLVKALIQDAPQLAHFPDDDI